MRDVQLATVMLIAATLRTVPSQAQHESVAESLFRQARGEMKRGQARSACPKFAESYRLDPSIGTLLNLALCEEAVGHTATAWTKLRQFIDAAPAEDGRTRIAREKITRLEAQLSWVRLVVEHDVDLVVQLDGIELREASLDEAIPVDPGAHSVRLTRRLTDEGNETAFEVRAAEKLTLRLSVPPRANPTEPAPASAGPLASTADRHDSSASFLTSKATPAPGGRHGEQSAGYILGTVGVAGLITGSVFGLMAMGDRNTVRAHCPNHECQSQTGLDAVESGRRNRTIANVAMVVGALGLVSGGALLWHSSRTAAALSVASSSASLSFIAVLQ